MNIAKRLTAVAMATILAVPATLTATSAKADGYWQDSHYHKVGHRRHRNNDLGPALVGGAIGLATGLIIGNSLNQPRYAPPPRYRGPVYHPHRAYRPAPVYRAAPAPVYRPAPPVYSYAPRPWTPEWYDYCHAKYRSFDPASGTFQPYNGPRRLCR